MKRDRSGLADSSVSNPGSNNTAAVGGYDAYFGTYRIDEKTGEAIHQLEGVLSPENVGIKVSRSPEVAGDQLQVRLATTTADNEPVTRTPTWKRVDRNLGTIFPGLIDQGEYQIGEL